MKIKKKTIFLTCLGLLFLFLMVLLSGLGGQNSQLGFPAPAVSEKAAVSPLVLPPVIKAEIGYEVLSVAGESSYRVKDLATGAEADLAVPSDAVVTGGKIEAGSILQVNKSSVFGNGILAFDLNVK